MEVASEEDPAQPRKLVSERKRGIPKDYQPPLLQPHIDNEDEIFANINGIEITVKEPGHIQRIYTMGNFGMFVGHRMNFANWRCFEPKESSSQKTPLENGSTSSVDEKLAKQKALEWIDKKSGGGLLHLSPIEAFYLFYDLGVIKLTGLSVSDMQKNDIFTLFKSYFGQSFVRHYQVYRYFRRLGWIVRDGIGFGVDFMLYKDGLELHHSCAGVRILQSMADSIVTDPSNHAAQRELSSCKKKLLLAAVEFSCSEDKLSLEDLDLAKVHILSMNHWNVNKTRAIDLDSI